jgi:hypothetical protein
VNNLGNLYANQGKLDKAEQIYRLALQGFEKAWSLEHTSLRTVLPFRVCDVKMRITWTYLYG